MFLLDIWGLILIKLISLVSFYFFNVITGNFQIIYEVHIIFPLVSTVIKPHLSVEDMTPCANGEAF